MTFAAGGEAGASACTQLGLQNGSPEKNTRRRLGAGAVRRSRRAISASRIGTVCMQRVDALARSQGTARPVRRGRSSSGDPRWHRGQRQEHVAQDGVERQTPWLGEPVVRADLELGALPRDEVREARGGAEHAGACRWSRGVEDVGVARWPRPAPRCASAAAAAGGSPPAA